MDQKLQPTWLEADGIINTSDYFVLIALNLQPLKFSLGGIFLIIKGGAMTIDIKNLPLEFIVPDNARDFYVYLGDIIKSVRCDRNLSIAQIAEMLHIDAEFVDAYERGELAIPVYHFFELAARLGYPHEFEQIHTKLFGN